MSESLANRFRSDGYTEWADEVDALEAENRRLREALVRHHVQTLDLCLSLAESDELYAAELRPTFKRVWAALAAGATEGGEE